MMKTFSILAVVATSLLNLLPGSILAQSDAPVVIYETPQEFFGIGDLDGDGRLDVVIVDKESGKYRLGYQSEPGILNWVDCRPSGTKGVTGFSLGKLIAKSTEALAFASADGNQITFLEAASPLAPGKPVTVPFTSAQGPSMVAAVDIGSAAKTGLLDFYIGSIYNSPDANMATLLRNDGAEFPKISENILPGAPVRANRLALKTGQPELLCL